MSTQAWNICATPHRGSIIVNVYLTSVFFGFDRQGKLDQPPDCFRTRGLVILLLGPAFGVAKVVAVTQRDQAGFL